MTIEQEIEWLLGEASEEVNTAITEGLEECLGRLCEKHSGFKLVVSSSNSEGIKGVITRAGTVLQDTDLLVKLHGVNKGHQFTVKLDHNREENVEIPLTQVVDAGNFLSEALQIATTGFDDMTHPHKGEMARVRISELLSYVRSAIETLKEPNSAALFPLQPTNTKLFADLPPDVAIDFYLKDSTLITDVRAIEYLDASGSGFNALLGRRRSDHAIPYNGSRVVVHERLRIESQDPNLISVAVKLNTLETHLEVLKRKLDVVLAL